MATPLLTTKFHIPPPGSNLVPRPRLLQRLDEGLRMGRRLTFVSAPAGYGKTTLICTWLQSVEERPAPPLQVSWLSLDDGDNDLARFFSYLVAALQKIDAPRETASKVGQTVQPLLEAPQMPPAEVLLTTLINDMAASPAPFVLVLDDYHTITEPAIHEAVGFLLDRQPPQMHLTIATRHDPPLPLSRLRARGQVTEIRQSDLRFSPEEATTFLNQTMGLNLSVAEIATLKDRTEGWISGLQLAALSVQGRDAEGKAQFIGDFSGRYHFILDYLADEVLKRQPEPVQSFLLQTSVLERMCGPLCDAVLGQDVILPYNGRTMLEALQQANLFVVPLDDERQWYRYHRLFGDLLRARLQETRPSQVPELHRRAAMWYERNGLSPEAVHHALTTQDFGLAADVIERAVRKMATWSRIGGATFLGWLKRLPDDVVHARPVLELFASRALYVTGQREASERVLQGLEQSLQEAPTSPDTERLLERVVADRASYAAVRGDVGQAIEYAQQALARLPEDNPVARIRPTSILGLACLRAGDVSKASQAFSRVIAAAQATSAPFAAAHLVCNLADIQIIQGRLRQAQQTCEDALQMGTVDGVRTTPTGFVGLVLGKILYEQNELQAAERHLSDGLELLRQGEIPASFGTWHALLAQIRQAQGDTAGARAAMQRALQLAQSSGIQRLSIQATAFQARIWLAQGDLDSAARWARDYRQLGETEYLREFEDLTLARVLLAQAEPAEALALLESLLLPAEAAGRMGHAIEILALRALALQVLDEAREALETLKRALKLAEPEGYVRLFVDEGEPMARLLRRAATQGIMPAYVSQLLAAFEGPEFRRMGEPLSPTPSQPLVEPLTAREMEVLHLLAEGLTNPEIAQRLFISLPTVKSHTSNIYGKLGVHSRRQAVAQARALGLLPPL